MTRAFTTTFYSYKGGVGRSLLLANVGAALAKGRHNVLLWDLDVEAPGLHRIHRLTPGAPQSAGFLDWLLRWQTDGCAAQPDEAAMARLAKLVYPVTGLDRLHVLPAFGDGGGAGRHFAEIDWLRFLADEPDLGLRLFETILDDLSARNGYTHILIDSRTGYTDLGGLLTIRIPQVTVLIGNYSRQNTGGLRDVWSAFDKLRDAGQAIPKRKLVASPVPSDDLAALEARRAVWTEIFPASVREEVVAIPLEPRLLIDERLAVLYDEDSKLKSAYEAVAASIEQERTARESEAAAEQKAARIWGGDEVRDERGPRSRKRQGDSFEDRVARLLRLTGFDVEPKQSIGGNEIDLVAVERATFRTTTWWVECKDHRKATPKSDLERIWSWVDGKAGREAGAHAMCVARSFSAEALSYAKDHSDRMVAVTVDELERKLVDFTPYLRAIRQSFESIPLHRNYVDQYPAGEAAPEKGERSTLLDRAVAWASGEGKPLSLVLGDYGTGKSAFFRRFAYELAVRAEDDPAAPIPIAIDLKEFANATSLRTLFQEHLRDKLKWHGDPDVLLHLLASGRIVLVLDSFDEMGVAAAGRTVEEQFRELASPTRDDPLAPGGNRVLITCRTHFFRTQEDVVEQTSGRRGEVGVSAGTALGDAARTLDAGITEIAPFDARQIRAFIEKRLGAAKTPGVMQFIANTYDLSSLAPRAVLLEMILDSLGEIAKTVGAVNPARLYDVYTTEWLKNRSGRALQTPYELRKCALLRLASELWDRDDRTIHWREFLGILERRVGEALRGHNPDQLELELRSATFLIRSADGRYRFSHKSFLEYFLARALFDAAAEPGAAMRVSDLLDTRPLSPEVIAFLLDLVRLDAAREPLLRGAIGAVLTSAYRARASENALWVARAAVRSADLATGGAWIPDGANLAGAQLAGADLVGLPLVGASLRGADLRRARADDAILTAADLALANLDWASFRRADLSRASFHRCNPLNTDLEGANLDEANLVESCWTASTFRHVFARTSLDARGARFVACAMTDFNAPGTLPDQAEFERCTIQYNRLDTRRGVTVPARGLRPNAAFAHAGGNAVAFTADGRFLATGADDGKARLFEVATGALVREFAGHAVWVLSVAFTADGRFLATGAGDHNARLFEVATGALVREFAGHGGGVWSVALTADGRCLATGSNDGKARLFDVATGALVREFTGHADRVASVAFTSDGRFLATGSDDGKARIFEAATGALVREFAGHGSWVWSVAFTADGRLLATGAREENARVFEAATGALLREFAGNGVWWSKSVAITPDGRLLAAGADDGTTRLFEVATGVLVRELAGDGHAVASVALTADGRFLATGTSAGLARLFDVATGAVVRELAEHGEWVTSVALTADGRFLATGAGFNRARVFDAATGSLVREFVGAGGSHPFLAFTADGRFLATQGTGWSAHLFEVSTGALVREFQGHRDSVKSVAFTADGRFLATGAADKEVRLFEVATGALVREFAGHGGRVQSVAFTADGRFLATGSDDQKARLFEVATGALVREFAGHEGRVESVAFTADGRFLATGSDDQKTRLFEAATGTLVRKFEGQSHLSFTADGRVLATVQGYRRACLYEVATGALLREFAGHCGRVLSMAFSANERYLVAGCEGGTSFFDVRDAESPWRASILSAGESTLVLRSDGRFRGSGDLLICLAYLDPDDPDWPPTIWTAADLVGTHYELRADEPLLIGTSPPREAPPAPAPRRRRGRK